MASFRRKFQNGDIVIVSNPKSLHSKPYLNEEFSVLQHDGSDLPYQLQHTQREYLTIWVKPHEISLKPAQTAVETQTQEESEEDKLDTSEFPKPKITPIPTVDFNLVAIKELAMANNDKVKLEFVPTYEMAVALGFDSEIANHIRSDFKSLNHNVGKEGHLTHLNERGGYSRIKFEDGNAEYYPIIGLKLISRPVIVGTFQASDERKIVIYTTHVFIDNNVYSFEFFEKLWETIKAHMKKPKTGDDRTITLTEGDYSEGYLRDNFIKVGCQAFRYTNVRRLMAAIRVARSV